MIFLIFILYLFSFYTLYDTKCRGWNGESGFLIQKVLHWFDFLDLYNSTLSDVKKNPPLQIYRD